ncbi:unnamed protein product [Amoebophrya sp. A25]|nr:unnamed protein product [Amoebophrya sp. A25]|eukprot:GSA25T00022889001.1
MTSGTARWQEQHDNDRAREPCPDRIVEDLGGAFGMGCIGGFLWHFVRGARNSPKGERLAGALYHGKMRAPILGGSFAVWGGTFATCDCTLQYIRQTDDSWNSIMSGFLTGGVLALRTGWKSAGKSAVVGGVILSCIEGVSALMARQFQKTPREQMLESLEFEKQQQEAMEAKRRMEEAGDSGSSGGGMFGGSSFGNAASPFQFGGVSSMMGEYLGGGGSEQVAMEGSVSAGEGFADSTTTLPTGFTSSSDGSGSTSSTFENGGLLPEGMAAAAAHDTTGASKGGSWLRLPRR